METIDNFEIEHVDVDKVWEHLNLDLLEVPKISYDTEEQKEEILKECREKAQQYNDLLDFVFGNGLFLKEFLSNGYKIETARALEIFDPQQDDDIYIFFTHNKIFDTPYRVKNGLFYDTSRVKWYCLLDKNGKEYQSVTPGQFGGHRKLKIYGRLDCPSAVRHIAKGHYIKYRVFFADEQTAIAAGYRPCGICMKEQYLKWKQEKMQNNGTQSTLKKQGKKE